MQYRSSKITKQKFHQINRDIKAEEDSGTYNAENLSKKHFVSRETVNAVRRAGTWPQWERNKAENNRKRVERARSLAPVSGVSAVEMRSDGINIEAALLREDDNVTIPRSLFLKYAGLEVRVKSLEVWRGKELKEQLRQALGAIRPVTDEPKVKRPFWKKR